jgi:hypothetical protein
MYITSYPVHACAFIAGGTLLMDATRVYGRSAYVIGPHCKKSVLKIQEYTHEGANLKFYIPEFFKFKLLILEFSPLCRFWF